MYGISPIYGVAFSVIDGIRYMMDRDSITGATTPTFVLGVFMHVRTPMMAGKIKYVSLEFDAFLGDADFQLMSAEERGAYISIILYLYSNNGRVRNDLTMLSKLCKVKCDFDFQTVLAKFQVKHGYLRHKRVTAELRRSQLRHTKAVTAAQSRWAKQYPEQSMGNANASSKQCQVKGSEVKGSNSIKENTKRKKFTPPALEQVQEYISSNPELNNVDAETFFKGYNDADPPWHDTRGNPVKNWKLKLRTWSSYGNNNRACPHQGSVKRNEHPEQNEPFIR